MNIVILEFTKLISILSIFIFFNIGCSDNSENKKDFKEKNYFTNHSNPNFKKNINILSILNLTNNVDHEIKLDKITTKDSLFFNIFKSIHWTLNLDSAEYFIDILRTKYLDEISFDLEYAKYRSFLFLKEKKYYPGIALLESCLNETRISDNSDLIEPNLILGQLYFQSTQYFKAKIFFNKTIEYSQYSLDTITLIYSHIQLASIFANEFEFNNCDSILEIISKYKSCYQYNYLLADIQKVQISRFYLEKDYSQAFKIAKIAIINSNLYSHSKYSMASLFALSAIVSSKKRNFKLSLRLIDEALNFVFSESGYGLNYENNIYSVSVLCDRLDILSEEAIQNRNLLSSYKIISIYSKIDSLINHFIFIDNESFIQNNYYNNGFYSTVIKYCSFMYFETKDSIWLKEILIYIGKYKSQLFQRNIRIKNAKDLFSNYIVEDVIKNYFEIDKIWAKDTFLHEDYCKLNSLYSSLDKNAKDIKEQNVGLFLYLYESKNINIEDLLKSKDNVENAIIYFYIGSDFHNTEKIYSLIFYKNKLFLILKDNPSDLVNLINKYRDEILSDNDFTKIKELSKSIFDLYISDIYDVIDSAKYITIVPDNQIESLPFESLIVGNKNDSYLVENAIIDYNYFVTDSINTIENSYTSKVLFCGWSDKRSINSTGDMNSTFSELPWSLYEVNYLNSIFSGKTITLLGLRFTKSNFLSEIENSNIIHISGHSRMGTNRFNNIMYFRSSHFDKYDSINSFEFRPLYLNANLVFLSSCESSSGEINEEEGTFNLSRTFSENGADYVIANKYTASDKFSFKIVKSFYNYLDLGFDYRTSLTMAKRDLFSDISATREHPKYWAGLTLYHN